MSIPLPDPTVAVALASIAVHAEEALEPGAHEFDIAAIRGALEAPGVRDYVASLDALALVPRKRSNDR